MTVVMMVLLAAPGEINSQNSPAGAEASLPPAPQTGLTPPPAAGTTASPPLPLSPTSLPRLPGILPEADQHITITTNIDKVVIRVGDLIHYSMVIEAPPGSKVLMPPPGVQLGEFLIRDYSFPELEKSRPANWRERLKTWRDRLRQPLGEGIIRQEFNFTITAYDTGDLMIPPLPVAVVDPQGRTHAFYTESARVRVVPFTSPEDLTIKDIKPPVEIPVPVSSFLPYLLIPVALLGVIGSVIFLLRRRRAVEEIEMAPRPEDEIALEELEELDKENLLAAGNYERFYTRLSYILRKYLAVRYTFYALEYTTNEIVETLKYKDLTHADHDRIARLLAEADLVKFARHEPALEERTTALERAREIIASTRRREGEEEMAEAA